MRANTVLGPPSANVRAQRWWLLLALLVWLVPMLVISVMVAANPTRRTVTPVYHRAVVHWQGQEGLYTGDYQYLPHFVPLFIPYHGLPLVAGEILWRWTAAVGLAWGVWWFSRRGSEKPDNRTFALISLCILPLVAPAVQNGQANAHLAACFLLAAVCLASQRWWWATLLLLLGVAIKPLGLAVAGLAFAAFPQLGWRLALGLPILAVMPFLFGPASYVQSQFVDAWLNLRSCAGVTEHRFADLNGLLRTVGHPLTGQAALVIRAGAGLVFMGFCWLSRSRLSPHDRALVWLAAAVVYLMLFNPMTEANSYIIFAPAAGLLSWQFFQNGRKNAAACVVGMLLTMGLLPVLLYAWLGNSFALAWHPLMTAGFAVLVATSLIPAPVTETSTA